MKYSVLTSMQKSISILHVKLEIRKNKRFTNILRLYLSTVLLFFGVLTINAQRNYWEGNEAKRIALTLDENLMFGNEIFTPFTIFLSDLSENFNVKSLKVASIQKREYSSEFNARTIATNSLRLWLKANEGGTSWSDQSGHGVNVTLEGTIASGFPLNYHRTNYFDGSGYYNTNLDISAGTYPYLSVISVYVPFDDPAGSLWGEGDGRNTNGRGDRVVLDYKSGSRKWNNTIGGGKFVFDVDDLFVKDVPTISTVIFDEDEPNGSSAYVNGKQEIRFTSNHSPGTSNPLEIGRVGYGNSRRFKGRVGEVLVYSGQPSRKRIESYLALKYGITLDQTTPQSYVNSSGAEIYDADGLFNSFDHDIIGIGQDNGSSLDQRISKSINTGSILFLSKDTNFTRENNDERRISLGNGNFLVTGHNGGSISFNSDFRGISNTRMTRIWGLDQTGIVDEVYVAISVTGFENIESLYVVVSNDQTFDESDTYSKMTKQNGFWVGSINPSDGNFMSFASILASQRSISNNIVAWLKSETGTNTTIDGNDVTVWNNSISNPVYDLRSFNALEFSIQGVSYALNSVPPTYESDADNLLNFHPSILFQNHVSGLDERLFTRGVDNRSEILNAQPIKGSTFYAIGIPRGYFNDFWSSFDSDDPMINDESPLGMIGDDIYFHVSKLDENGEFETESILTNTTWENGEIALLKVTIPNVNTTSVTYNKNGGADDVINDVYVGGGYYHVLGNIGNIVTPETGLSFDNHFGNIAETIIYGTASLSDVESSRIESYLALKYGITLDQTTPQSYVNSKGAEIYDADGAFDAFDHDIIGIGEDDGSSLDQRISKSANAESILILSNDSDFTSVNMDDGRTSLGDGNFLVTGHNGSSIAFTENFDGIDDARMSRVWAFGETGKVGHISIALPTSEINALVGDYLYAVLSNDQTFDRSDTFTKMNSEGGFWHGKINPKDGYFMTFVSTDVNLSLDLYIKDSPDDLGEEPNLITKKFWRSPDIWVRNNPDRSEEHQSPKTERPNYVYVRVQNRSRVVSQGNDQVKLYWRKAGTVSGWPEGWTGGYQNIDGSTIKTNGLVGTVTIPELSPGEEAILQFTWNVPSTIISFGDSNPWHFCFLARIVSEDDPMTDEEEGVYTTRNARRNNNIAWKNVTVVKASSRKRKCNKWDNNCSVKKGGAQSNFISFGGLIFVGNPFNEAKTFSLELVKEESETGKAIFDEAKVVLTMNKTLYNAWERGGKQSELLKNTNDEKKKIVTGNHARLNNLRFGPNEFGLLNVSFNFLTKELTDKLKFVYHVIQKEVETGEVVGGETYVINKDLQMEFEGSIKEDRKLEINNKTISIDKASLDKIIPNPASNTARFTYNLGGAKSAYLRMTGFYHGAIRTLSNYVLDAGSIEAKIDLTNYSDGYYQVELVCDGKVIDAKTLIKE